jgi:AsmA protein
MAAQRLYLRGAAIYHGGARVPGLLSLRPSCAVDNSDCMRKIVKYAAVPIAALLLVLLVGGAVLLATWDPNDHKSQIVQFVQDKSQRTMAIPGRLRLSVFPKLGVEFDAVTLTERGAAARFASIAGGKVSMALLPLLQKRLVLDRITLSGLKATLKRFSDGSTNVDDLLAKPAGPGQFSFDIAGLELTQGELELSDAVTATTLALRQIELKTGRLADRVPTAYEVAFRVLDKGAKIDALFRGQGAMTFDLEAKDYQFSRTQTLVEGSIAQWRNVQLSLVSDFDVKPAAGGYALASGVLQAHAESGADRLEFSAQASKIAMSGGALNVEPLTGKASLRQGERNVEASFRLPGAAGSLAMLRLNPLAVDWKLAQRNLQVAGTSAADVSIDTKTRVFKALDLTSSAKVKQGSNDLVASMGGRVTVDARAQSLAANELMLEVSGKVGKQTLNAHASGALTGNLSTQSYQGKLAALDLSVDEKAAQRAARFTCTASIDSNREGLTLDVLVGDLTRCFVGDR